MSLFTEGKNRTSWRSLAAVYTTDERRQIQDLPVNEQFVLHSLKAFFGGEIQPASASTLHVSPKPEMPKYIDAEDIPFGDPPVRRSDWKPREITGILPSLNPCPECGETEDSPSWYRHRACKAPPVRRPKRSYRLEWTNGTPSLHKTKKVAQRRMRAWVQWKRRNGWNVVTHPTGYFAGRDSVREAVLIREIEKPAK